MREDRNSEENCNDRGLNEELKEKPLEVRGHNIGGDQGASYNPPSNSVNKEALETCVVIDSPAQVECVNGGDNRKLEAKTNESGLQKLSIKEPKGMSKTDKNSCMIDLNCENLDDD
jgi:hypothetical protein